MQTKSRRVAADSGKNEKKRFRPDWAAASKKEERKNANVTGSSFHHSLVLPLLPSVPTDLIGSAYERLHLYLRRVDRHSLHSLVHSFSISINTHTRPCRALSLQTSIFSRL